MCNSEQKRAVFTTRVYESIWVAANVHYKLRILAFGAVGAKSRTGDLRCSAIYMKSRYALPSSAGVSEKRQPTLPKTVVGIETPMENREGSETGFI
jgi:hypothetical protein